MMSHLSLKNDMPLRDKLYVPTRHILDSKGAIPTKTVADTKVAIQEMAEYSQKWHNGTSLKAKSTETSNRLDAIQAQLSNLGREIKKFNEKVYAAQVGCELCKGPHYTKDYPLKQEEKTLEETYYTQFGASVSVMPFSTYSNLGLGVLAHTMLNIELADRTIKHPRGIAKNVLVRIGKFIFLIDFVILDIPEDDDVPLILGRPFLSTAHAKIDVFKRKFTLRVGEEKLVFKSVKPATSIIRRVYMDAIRRILGFEIRRIDLMYRPCCKEIDDMTFLAFCLGKTLPVLKLGCVFSQDLVAFCLKDFLRTDFASWQQRIRLYCRGKENGVNILKSINEGPFQMGTVREPLAEGTEGAPHLAVKLNRGLRDSNYDQLYAYLKQHETHANENKMMLDQFSQHIVDPLALMSNFSHQQHYSPSSSTLPSTYVPPHLADNALLDSKVQLDMGEFRTELGMLIRVKQDRLSATTATAQENEVALDAEQLLFLAGGQDNAIDDDVDEQPAPTAQTMFMASLSFVDLVTDEARPSYDSDILSEVQDQDQYQDAICAHHEEHAMHGNVKLNHVVDLHANYTSDSNMIPYDQYVKDNTVPVVHSNVSPIPNDDYMMIILICLNLMPNRSLTHPGTQ
uniref:Reverse transcriptase domain-containing protein n=1 Tax=Tanacetum cinerariifolium TaxID=118510 RepID=A0A6L2NIZ0_TANCI|nr:hypothetical protein [Tanacetum cinerariifolium]